RGQKGERGVRLAAHIKRMGGHKLRRVTVGRRNHPPHSLPRPNDLVPPWDLGDRDTGKRLDRRIVAQALLCGQHRMLSRCVCKHSPLLWVTEECQESIAD